MSCQWWWPLWSPIRSSLETQYIQAPAPDTALCKITGSISMCVCVCVGRGMTGRRSQPKASDHDSALVARPAGRRAPPPAARSSIGAIRHSSKHTGAEHNDVIRVLLQPQPRSGSGRGVEEEEGGELVAGLFKRRRHRLVTAPGCAAGRSLPKAAQRAIVLQRAAPPVPSGRAAAHASPEHRHAPRLAGSSQLARGGVRGGGSAVRSAASTHRPARGSVCVPHPQDTHTPRRPLRGWAARQLCRVDADSRAHEHQA